MNHFELMKLALKTKSQSTHDTHKVGALITCSNMQVSRPNLWSEPLKKHIGKYNKLGNSSTTTHAEMAVICASETTENTDLYITDLPCPNCAKLIAEARISNVYIDSNAPKTILGTKIKPYFNDISKLILKKAGVSIFEINLDNKIITPIIQASPNTLQQIHRPILQKPLDQKDINRASFLEIIEKITTTQNLDNDFVACYAKSSLGQYSFLLAQPHRSIGISEENSSEINSLQDKYTAYIQPINRLLVTCARYGIKIDQDYLYSSQTPTSRELVNLIGAGYTKLHIENDKKCRDNWGLEALKQLKDHGIIDFT